MGVGFRIYMGLGSTNVGFKLQVLGFRVRVDRLEMRFASHTNDEKLTLLSVCSARKPARTSCVVRCWVVYYYPL